jgi:hypothetical protein
MNPQRAALHVAPDATDGAHEGAAQAALDPDPLRRLEAELQRAGDARPEGERLHEQAWALLEEAWSLLTECLVLRDGLLDACREIEHTMEGIGRRLGAADAGDGRASAQSQPASAGRRLESGSNALVP